MASSLERLLGPVAESVVAESVGFEPTVTRKPQRFSRPRHADFARPENPTFALVRGTFWRSLSDIQKPRCTVICRRQWYHSGTEGSQDGREGCEGQSAGRVAHDNCGAFGTAIGCTIASVSSVPTHPEVELSPEARGRLEAAHRKLREAVADYQQFTDSVLEPGKDAVSYPASDLADAQRAVEQAEQELWVLREELLGWTRPSWAPSASFAADWFSEEDAVYDEPNSTTAR